MTERTIDNEGLFSDDVKREAWTRDGGRCRECGNMLVPGARNPNIRLHYDHVVPWSRGGNNTLGNCQLLCVTHNLRKGATMPAGWSPPTEVQPPVVVDWAAELDEVESSLAQLEKGLTASSGTVQVERADYELDRLRKRLVDILCLSDESEVFRAKVVSLDRRRGEVHEKIHEKIDVAKSLETILWNASFSRAKHSCNYASWLRKTHAPVQPGTVQEFRSRFPERDWWHWHQSWQKLLLTANAEVVQWIAKHDGKDQFYLDQAAGAVEQLRITTREWAEAATSAAAKHPELREYADWAVGWWRQAEPHYHLQAA